MTIDINIIATVLSVIASAIAIVVAISKRGKTDGTMQSDIGYIKAQLDRIIAKQEKQDDFNMQVNTRLTAVV